VAYLAVQVVCTVILTCGVEVVSTDQTFHRLEFGATFVFALVTTFSLVCSPERDFCSPLLLKFLVFANVGNTLVSFLLVLVNLERFETASHQIEYANELTMAGAELLLAAAVLSEKDAEKRVGRKLVAAAVLSSLLVASAQLFIYNVPWGGEIPAHYLEFAFGTLCAGGNFWFCVDSMALADQLKRQIMLAPEGLTVVIDPFSRHGVHDHSERDHYYTAPAPAGRSCCPHDRCGGEARMHDLGSHSHGGY